MPGFLVFPAATQLSDCNVGHVVSEMSSLMYLTCSLEINGLFLLGRGGGVVTFPASSEQFPESYRAAFFLFTS